MFKATEQLPEAQARQLLAKFSPILRFTQGELFFPMRVEPYIQVCSLWQKHPNEPSNRLLAPGQVTLDNLKTIPSSPKGAIQYLKFVEPLNIAELASYRLRAIQRGEQPLFHPGPGRLARVGYTSRVMDALFVFTRLLRGRVPGDTVAAAIPIYQQIQQQYPGFHYYGRAIKQHDWVVLQYWFFYAFNNWRTRFYGANDHEADWEMVSLFLCPDENNTLKPEWAAYAAHDYHGDDFRRRWDDPTLEIIDGHPVVYAGAGSHASYFTAGEYLTEIELPYLNLLNRITLQQRAFWRRVFGADESYADQNARFNILTMPFVDYARGDGLSIGYGQTHKWDEPQLLSPTPDWTKNYRGLWGLFTGDPVAGEDAPAGPRYTRSGNVRLEWGDPIAWAGLNKVPPPHKAVNYTLAQQETLKQQTTDLEIEISTLQDELLRLGVENEAIQNHPHLKQMRREKREAIKQLNKSITDLIQTVSANYALIEALEQRTTKLQTGERTPPDWHLRRPLRPMARKDLQAGLIAETWAATSISLVMLGVVILILFAKSYVAWGLLGLLAGVVVVEAVVRRRLSDLISKVTIVLAILSAMIIVYEFFWAIIVIIFLTAGVYLLRANIQELRKH